MEKFRADKGEPWPMVFGKADNSANYGVSGIPHFAIIDRSGKVAYIHIGYSEQNFIPMQEKLKEMFGGN